MRTKYLVKQILSQKKETRDNDKLLILYVWQAQGLVLTPAQIEKFKQVASPETVRRIRQKFQEDGQFLASEAVEENRFNMYKETRDAIATAPEAVSWLND